MAGKRIASAIRHARGGHRVCKAMGFEITERNQAQVSMNLVNFKKTPVHRVFQTIENEANRWGAVGAHVDREEHEQRPVPPGQGDLDRGFGPGDGTDASREVPRQVRPTRA